MRRRSQWVNGALATCVLAVLLTAFGAVFGEVTQAYAGYGYCARSVWNDEGHEEMRPDSITLSVMWGGKERATLVLSESSSTLMLPADYAINTLFVPSSYSVSQGGTVITGENQRPWTTGVATCAVRAYYNVDGVVADDVTYAIAEGNIPEGYEVEYDHYSGDISVPSGETPIGGYVLFGEVQVVTCTYTGGNKLTSLRGKLSNAEARQPYAEHEVKVANKRRDNAQTAYDAAQKEFDDAKAEAETKKAAWDTAKKAVTTANNNVNAAQAALDQNAADIADTQAQIKADKTAVNNAQAATKSAQQRVNTANSSVQTAQGKVDAAQADIDAEVDDPGNNAGHKEWTAYGFFQSVRDAAAPGSAVYWDAQCAMDILDGGSNTTGHSYPYNQGPEPDGYGASTWASIANGIAWDQRGDAVSLDNMRTSLEFLREFNSIRAEENDAEGTSLRTDIGTNLRQMAISIVQCDASKDYSVSHTQAYEGLENLSWSSARGVPFSRNTYRDPYVGWYDEEKQNYKRGSGVTGHYTTIVDLNSNYFCEIAGFAVCNYGASYGECRELSTFGDFTYYDSNPTPEVQYSVDDLIASFDAYYNEQVEAGMFGTTDAVRNQHRQALDVAQGELDAALAEQQSANDALAAAQADEQNAKDTLADAQSQLTTLQGQTSGLQSTLNAQKTTLDQKKEAANTAKGAYEDAAAALKAIEDKGDVAQTKAALEQADEDVVTAQEELDAARASLTSAQNELDAFTNLSQSEAIKVAALKAVTYTGKAQKPKPIVTAELVAGKTTTLVSGTDYTLTYSANTNAGTATVTIRGTGSKGSGTWWGTRKVTFAIKRAAIAVPRVTARTYNGKVQRGVAKGTGYTLTGVQERTNAGTYTVYATPDANHCWTGGSTAKKAIKWTISPKKVTPTVQRSRALFAYTGKQQRPTLTVKVGTTKLATSQYIITWPKNTTNVGIHTVKVTLKGNYSGTKSVTYTIVPKATTVSKVAAASKAFTVTWAKRTTQTTGYQIQYCLRKNFASGVKTVTVKGTSTTSRRISGLTAKKTYYVRVRTYRTVNGKNYYSTWSAVKSVTTK